MRASEIRQRLNEISGLEGDALSDEITTESENLQTEYRAVETKRRAALVADDVKETDVKAEPDAEERERLELRGKVKMADYIDAASSGGGVSGAALEFNQALEIRSDRFPLSLLAPDVEERESVEERASTDTNGRVTQGSWVDRVFAMTAARRLGVTFASVSPGQVSYPVVTAGASPAQRGRAEAAVDAAWTVGSTAIEPTRNSVRALFNRVDALRLPGLEDALRRELRMALTEGIDRAIFQGDATANEDVADIVGFTTAAGIGEEALTQANKVKADKVLEAFVNMVDGVYAAGLGDLNVVSFVGAWKLWETTIHNSAVDNETLARFLRAAGVSWGLRGGIEAATTAGKFGAIVGRSRGIANSAVAAVWEDAALVRDPYSDSAKADVSLSLHTFWGFKIPRTDSFKRIKFS